MAWNDFGVVCRASVSHLWGELVAARTIKASHLLPARVEGVMMRNAAPKPLLWGPQDAKAIIWLSIFWNWTKAWGRPCLDATGCKTMQNHAKCLNTVAQPLQTPLFKGSSQKASPLPSWSLQQTAGVLAPPVESWNQGETQYWQYSTLYSTMRVCMSNCFSALLLDIWRRFAYISCVTGTFPQSALPFFRWYFPPARYWFMTCQQILSNRTPFPGNRTPFPGPFVQLMYGPRACKNGLFLPELQMRTKKVNLAAKSLDNDAFTKPGFWSWKCPTKHAETAMSHLHISWRLLRMSFQKENQELLAEASVWHWAKWKQRVGPNDSKILNASNNANAQTMSVACRLASSCSKRIFSTVLSLRFLESLQVWKTHEDLRSKGLWTKAKVRMSLETWWDFDGVWICWTQIA